MAKINKKEIIEEIFKICKQRNNFVFDNDLVKNIIRKYKSRTNPYDMTKLDDTSKFPKILLEEDYFVIHLGDGNHKFERGINKVFHKFEEISNEEIIEWPYRPSILNDFSISESSVLSLCFNHRIIHDFLYLDIAANPKIYNSERKRGLNLNYKIGNINLFSEKLQIEIDLTMEYNGIVTVFEGKNTKNRNSWLENFNVFQLFNPYKYYLNLQKESKIEINELNACYLIRQRQTNGSIIRLYKYTFTNPDDITTISLLKKREYRLTRRGFDA